MSLGPTLASPACRPSQAACAPCYFGAHTTLLSYPYKVVPLTVDVIPYVTPFPNGSTATSYLTTTRSESISGGTLTGAQVTGGSALTWKLDDSIVLTSPTTYVQYTDFYGAPGITAPVPQPTVSPSCLAWGATKFIPIPSSVDIAPFVVPLTSNVSNAKNDYTQVPLPILDYLETLDWINAVMDHEDLATCIASPISSATQSYSPCTTVFESTITTCVPSVTLSRFNISSCETQTIVTTITSTINSSTSVPGRPNPPSSPNPPAYPSSPTTSISWGYGTSTGRPGHSTSPFPPSPPSTSSGPRVTPPPQPSSAPSATIFTSSSDVTHSTALSLTTFTRSPQTVPFTYPIIQPSLSATPGQSSPLETSSPASDVINRPTGDQGTATIDLPSQSSGINQGQTPEGQVPPLGEQLPPSGLSSAASAIVVGSQTVLPGQTANIGGTTLSVAPTGNTVYINGQPTSIGNTPLTLGANVLSVVPASTPQPTPQSGGQELVVGTQTISLGQVATIAGTTLSFGGQSGGTIYVNGLPTSISGSIMTVAGTTLTLVPQSPPITLGIGGLADASQTILPGQAVTTDGATISLPSSAGTVYINGHPSVISGPTVTVGTDVFTVLSITKVVVATSTTDGGAIFRASVSSTKKSSAAQLSSPGYTVCCWLVSAMLLLYI